MARKSRPNLFDLPALELECMKAVWALGEATVEDVRARLLPVRPLAYTTVLTVMDRLARKGLVDRAKRGRAHVYTSAIPEASIRDYAVQRLVENFFGGSREELRAHLSGASPGDFEVRVPEPPPRPAPRPPRKRKKPVPRAEEIDTSLL
jgi:BlaI family transcriptional regulator, penicillinase repressor